MKARTWLILAILAIAAISIYFVSSKQQKQDHLKFIRNSWSSYIYREKIEYRYNRLGGIDAFDVHVRNNTEHFIDELVVTVKYIKTSGGTYKTENVTISNIPPNSVKTGRAPNSPRGTSIEADITQVISRGLNLCYPGGNGDMFDPYACHR